MLEGLYRTCVDVGLVAGATGAGGWGTVVRDQGLPHVGRQAGLVEFDSLADLEALMAAEEARLKKTRGHSPVTQVVRTLPAEVGRQRLEIVDTPGLKQLRAGAVSQETIDDF